MGERGDHVEREGRLRGRKAVRPCTDCHTPWPVDRMKRDGRAWICELCKHAQFYYEEER